MIRLKRSAVFLCAASLAACSVLTNLDGYAGGGAPDGSSDAAGDEAPSSPGDDAEVDARTSDAGPDAPADAASDAPADVAAPTIAYKCGTNTVSDCAQCASSPFNCVLCANKGADSKTVFGVCVTSANSGSACQGRGPAGYDDCLCTSQSDPSPCTAPYHVCLAGGSETVCRNCGYSGSAGVACRGGGVCSAAGSCQ